MYNLQWDRDHDIRSWQHLVPTCVDMMASLTVPNASLVPSTIRGFASFVAFLQQRILFFATNGLQVLGVFNTHTCGADDDNTRCTADVCLYGKVVTWKFSIAPSIFCSSLDELLQLNIDCFDSRLFRCDYCLHDPSHSLSHHLTSSQLEVISQFQSQCSYKMTQYHSLGQLECDAQSVDMKQLQDMFWIFVGCCANAVLQRDHDRRVALHRSAQT